MRIALDPGVVRSDPAGDAAMMLGVGAAVVGVGAVGAMCVASIICGASAGVLILTQKDYVLAS